MPQFLLIDGSYYIFYRYHALLQWWKHSKPDDPLGNPIENIDFMERFKSVFVKKIQEVIKKLKLDKPIIIVAMDCKRKDIWRNSLFDKYKEGRVCDPHIGEIFNIVATDELFKKANVKMLLQHPTLEADDCIALTVKNIKGVVEDYKIHIITSDMDYLQLVDENVQPINLKYKYLQDSKQSFKDCKKDLFCKIVMGDKSDAIPSVFPKCGIKTAEKYYNNKELFQEILNNNPEAKQQFELNTTLIDFDKIPTDLVLDFNTGKYTIKY